MQNRSTLLLGVGSLLVITGALLGQLLFAFIAGAIDIYTSIQIMLGVWIIVALVVQTGVSRPINRGEDDVE